MTDDEQGSGTASFEGGDQAGDDAPTANGGVPGNNERGSAALEGLRRLEPGGSGRRRKVSRWDRVVVHDLRWAIGFAGRVLIAVGLLMFGFVAYQLWGTGIETSRAQNALESEFAELEASAAPTPVTTTSTTPTTTAPTTTRPRRTTTTSTTVAPTTLPPIAPGDALGRIEIPRIGLEFYIVAGVSTEDLKRGVGHYSETPLPGELGNSAFAGHRTTYGQPFFHIDEVQPGDEIILTTLDGTFVYRMTSQQIVSPNDYHVVTTTDPTVATLTLTSCHPRWSASERIVVSATLDTEQSRIVRNPVRQYPTTTAATTTSTTSTFVPTTASNTRPGSTSAGSSPNEVTTTAAPPSTADSPVITPGAGGPSNPDELSDEATDAFSHGWFSDTAALGQVALWATAVTLVTVLAYLLARRFRHLWVGVAVGTVPFLVALYFFYQNVNRLLPPAL